MTFSHQLTQTMSEENYVPNGHEWVFLSYVLTLPRNTTYFCERTQFENVRLHYAHERMRGRLLLHKLSARFIALVERAVAEYAFATDGVLW